MRTRDVVTFLESQSFAADLTVLPGLNTDPDLQDMSPGPMVLVACSNGSGFTTEALYDKIFINVRTIGDQGDFDGAEDIAWNVDTALCQTFGGNGMLGSAKVLYVVRTGGAPQLIQHDSADRYHFQNTYITETQTGY